MSNRTQMLGKIFGSWEILELDSQHPRTAEGILYYKAKCLECLNIYSVKGALMRNGGSKRCTKCGCKHSHAPQFGQVRTKRTAEESAFHYLFLSLRKNAKKRGLEWTLTAAEVKSLVTNDCQYCGQEPNNVCTPLKNHGLSQRRAQEATIVRNGIDRVDNDKGYVTGNVVSCCSACNIAKMANSARSFLIWAKKLAKHQGWTK